MKKGVLALFCGILISVNVLQGQEVWSLQQCIDYALENNIQIKQQALAVQYQENQAGQSRNDRLPNLNGQLGNNYNFGRSLTYQNTYENTNSISLSGGMGADITLWNGSTLQNAVRQRELELMATLQDLRKAREDISLTIAALYLDILFAEELSQLDENQMEITRQQLSRTRQLVDAGSLARGALLEIEAQLAREELQLVNAQNRTQLAYLNLYQLLELPVTRSFRIEKPQLPDLETGPLHYNSYDIFNSAVQTRPEIAAAQLRMESAYRQLDQAKGARYPRLSFGGNYYNNFNDNYTEAIDNNPLDRRVIPFGRQLKNNQRYGFGFTLNVPIFNRYQVRTAISNAEIQIIDYEYRLQSARNNLQKDIELAYTNAIAALKRYISGEKSVIASEEAFRYSEERFGVGMVTTVEYNQIKNNLNSAQSQLLQAKYEFIFRTKILDFYNGVPISL